MFSSMRNVTFAATLLVLAGCGGGITAVEPGPFNIKKDYQVILKKIWTAYPPSSRTHMQSLTVDGLSLNSLSFGASIKDGESLIGTTDPKKLVPKFRSDMTPNEVAEFVQDTLSFAGLKELEATNLRPEGFGVLEGLRFDMTGALQNGLNISGTTKAAIEDGNLHLILYYAPAEYYYDLHKDEVDDILASVRLL